MVRMALGAVAALAAIGGFIGGPAHAGAVDFVEEAAGNERGIADGTTLSFDGLDVTFTAENGFAYFDDLLEGRPGGLGVCGALEAGSGSECANPGDDNISSGESVALAFGTTVQLSGLSFNDAEHFGLNDNAMNTLLIAINGGAFEQFTFADAAALVLFGVDAIAFGFDDSGSGLEFYVSGFDAAVPLPAAAPFMIAGLAGLSVWSRRRRGV